jgi:serine/threonine-protein kinase
MITTLDVIAGPHQGKAFTFDTRDSFLVGRSKEAHFRLPPDDPYFSRRHFLLELQPPRCRLLDLNSTNGVFVNGARVAVAELRDGDQVQGGNTVFQVRIELPEPDAVATWVRPVDVGDAPSTAPHPPEMRPAQVLGDYRIGRPLGRGAMGVVYLGTRLADGRAVAIKQIIHQAPPKAIDLFLREIDILRSLKHLHIVEFVEVVSAAGGPYLVMEYVDGVDAKSLVKTRGAMPVRSAVRLISQVAAGLLHAHQAGFVHRDVKPANILVSGPKSGRIAKLADFGLARAYETSKLSGLTMNHEFGGTPAFMTPEQITHYRSVKPAADQYSLGATLYYLLTGEYVHDLPPEGTATNLIVKILTDPIVPLRVRRAELPAALAAIVERSLEKDPASRYPSLREFREALRPFRRETAGDNAKS